MNFRLLLPFAAWSPEITALNRRASIRRKNTVPCKRGGRKGSDWLPLMPPDLRRERLSSAGAFMTAAHSGSFHGGDHA